MRVIAGSARRLNLKTIEGLDTRPTTDRIKETLFNMINLRLPGSTFLDLFSGSGVIGIEALSRGAVQAVFVEQNPKAVECIRENLRTTRLEGKNYVFDTVFMDPPYDRELERLALEYLAGSELIDENSVIIVEASLATDFSYVDSLGYQVTKSKEYKTNKHVFITKGE